MGYGTTIIHYDGTNVGPVYLKDIGMRNQLGGGKGIYTLGQDQYIDFGSDATLLSTSDVMLSYTKGVIATNVANGVFTVTLVADA
jgi:hypothetical protein